MHSSRPYPESGPSLSDVLPLLVVVNTPVIGEVMTHLSSHTCSSPFLKHFRSLYLASQCSGSIPAVFREILTKSSVIAGFNSQVSSSESHIQSQDGNTNPESLSAFFPFYRNHNTLSVNPQEAYVWSSVIDATKTAMNIRYQLLPYMYTLFYLAHNTGSTVMRALAWEFPNDPSLAAADRQFFLGPAILVIPVLDQGYDNVSGVFPGVGKGEVYYDWYNLSAVNAMPGDNITIDAPLGHIPVYIRGKNIMPIQEPAMVTRDARNNPWGLIAALSLEGTASGSLYIDDGASLVQNATLYVEVSSHF